MPRVADPALNELIAAELPRLIELRHDLHRHPQLAFEETYASDRVQRWLSALGVPFKAGLAETGVVAWIEPGDVNAAAPGAPAVGLRADMDALPIEEATGLAYASRTPGKMHACGHDGHTTILLGAASVLHRLRDRLPRPVKLVFQPAEERNGGAAKMIEAGALDAAVGGRAVSHMFGLHGWPTLRVGALATKPGPVMASTDLFRIVVRGRGGHGARPHHTADPIVAASQLVAALQSIVSRNVDPTLPAVVTVGSFHAGQTENVIPESAELGGTIRAIDDATAALIKRRLRDIAQQTAAAFDCAAEFELMEGYPSTLNDAAAVDHVLATARRVLGDAAVTCAERPEMVAEDFAFYSRRVPSAFYFLGLRPPDRDSYPGLHTATFDFNDDALAPGVRMMCELALGAGALTP